MKSLITVAACLIAPSLAACHLGAGANIGYAWSGRPQNFIWASELSFGTRIGFLVKTPVLEALTIGGALESRDHYESGSVHRSMFQVGLTKLTPELPLHATFDFGFPSGMASDSKGVIAGGTLGLDLVVSPARTPEDRNRSLAILATEFELTPYVRLRHDGTTRIEPGREQPEWEVSFGLTMTARFGTELLPR